MPETAVKEYISQDMFNMQIKHLRDRADSDKQVSSARFDRLEALMDKTLIEIKMDNAKLHSEVSAMNERIDKNLAEYKALLSNVRSELKEEIGYVRGDLKEEINELKGDVKALNARFETLQNKFSWNLAWFGIIIGAVLAVIQHFWK